MPVPIWIAIITAVQTVVLEVIRRYATRQALAKRLDQDSVTTPIDRRALKCHSRYRFSVRHEEWQNETPHVCSIRGQSSKGLSSAWRKDDQRREMVSVSDSVS